MEGTYHKKNSEFRRQFHLKDFHKRLFFIFWI